MERNHKQQFTILCQRICELQLGRKCSRQCSKQRDPMGNGCHAQDLYRHWFTGMRSANIISYNADEQAGGPDPSGARPHVSKEQTADMCNRRHLRFILRSQSSKSRLDSDKGSGHRLRDRRDGWGRGWSDAIEAGHRIFRNVLLFDWDSAWLFIIHCHEYESSEHFRQHGRASLQRR
jgi:hypothetical protein